MKINQEYFDIKILALSLYVHDGYNGPWFDEIEADKILHQIAADAAKVQRERCWVLCSLRDLNGSPRCKKCSATVKFEVPGE